MKIFQVIYHLFATRLRLSNPWNYKAPVLISLTYLVMQWQQFQLQDALFSFLFSITTIIGIAGFGYLSNDLGDRKADRLARKPNLLTEISSIQIVALVLGFLLLAIVPWIVYFPLNQITGSLLVAEFCLLVLYVLPPFRFKERGVLGLCTDALYAHVNPAILAAITFAALAQHAPQDFWELLCGIGFWQFFLGIRNILLHQLKDADNDRRSKLKTFVVSFGELRTLRLLHQIVVPLELLSWLIYLFVLIPFSWLPIVAWPIYLLWKYPQQRGKLDLRGWLYTYLDDFYIPYFPVLVLISLVIADWRMSIVLLLHILLFKTAFSPVRDCLFSFFRKRA